MCTHGPCPQCQCVWKLKLSRRNICGKFRWNNAKLEEQGWHRPSKVVVDMTMTKSDEQKE